MYQKKEKTVFAKNEPSFVTIKCCEWLIGIILGNIICESLNWQHRLKITILGANWQLLYSIIYMFIFYFVYTKHQVLLICNENKEISVTNLMIQ